MAKELKGPLGLTNKVSKAQNALSKSGRVGNMTAKVLNSLGKITRPISTIAKGLTVAAAGDIPDMVKGWIEKGKEMVDQKSEPTLRQNIPSFQKRFTN
jgi:type IV secretory pathway TrbL component